LAPNDASSGPGPAADSNAVAGAVHFKIDRTQLIQVQQRADGSIPMVAGRDAYLRVFVTADPAYDAGLSVRAQFFYAGASVFDQTVSAARPQVPATGAGDGNWQQSWNFLLPGEILRPGISMRIETDPQKQIAGATRDTYPIDPTQQAQAQNVVNVAAYRALAVVIATPDPVNSANPPVLGNLNSNNLQTYYELALAALPVHTYTLNLRPGTFAINLQLAANGNNWNTALGDLRTAQYADPNGPTTYWFGLTRLPYRGSGVCGIDSLGGPTGFAEDDDFLGMPWAQQSVAHEEGHGFGLSHSPCGGPASIDPNWPTDAAHANAQIGTWGIQVGQKAVLPIGLASPLMFAPSSTDIMSYCPEAWFSDFSYAKALSHQTVSTAQRQAMARRPTAPRTLHLFISGTLRDGQLQVHHAVRALGVDSFLPTGPYRLTGYSALGATLFSVNFSPTPLMHRTAPGTPHRTPSESYFTMAVPIDEAQLVSEFVLTRPGRRDSALRRSASEENLARLHRNAPSAVDLQLSAVAAPGGRVRLRWDPQIYAKGFVKTSPDHMIGVVRDGDGEVFTEAATLEVQFTDGFDSLSQTVDVR
jgi:hypothetical protein